MRVSELSRRRLSADYSEFKRRIDLPLRVRNSLRNHPREWFGGTALLGLVASLLFRKKKRVVEWHVEGPAETKRRAGILGFLGGLVTLASPVLMALGKSWLKGQVRHIVATQTLPPFLTRAYPLVSRFSKPR